MARTLEPLIQTQEAERSSSSSNPDELVVLPCAFAGCPPLSSQLIPHDSKKSCFIDLYSAKLTAFNR